MEITFSESGREWLKVSGLSIDDVRQAANAPTSVRQGPFGPLLVRQSYCWFRDDLVVHVTGQSMKWKPKREPHQYDIGELEVTGVMRLHPHGPIQGLRRGITEFELLRLIKRQLGRNVSKQEFQGRV